MAKNKVYIDIVVDDKGTTKRVAVNAKKLGVALEQTGKGARTADRNLKGAAQASANGTKNFSKMAQGISGGLVPAYATLAANVFAVTAAFSFFKSAADLRVVQESQENFARSTGTSLSLLTSRIQEATDGVLTFQEAAQAVSIGTASGLNSEQLSGLAKVAKNASLALGRDLSDSFDRLVRGATKAEPELLDELGIILRLETATEKYGAALNKNAKDLTAYQRTQAVVNEILEQGNEKFDDLGGQVNKVAKLGKSFNDLLKDIKGALNPITEFFAGALANNVLALAGAFTLLGQGVLKAIIPVAPALADIGEAADAATKRIQAALPDERSTLGKNIASGTIGGREIAALERSTTAASSKVVDYSKTTQKAVSRDVAIIKARHQAMIAQNTSGWKRWSASAKAELFSLQATHGKVMGTMTAAVNQLGRVASKIIGAAGLIGLLFTALGIIKELLEKLKDPALLKALELTKAVREAAAEQNEAVSDILGNLINKSGTVQENIVDLANTISNLNFSPFEKLALSLDGLTEDSSGVLGITKLDFSNTNIEEFVGSLVELKTSVELQREVLQRAGKDTTELDTAYKELSTRVLAFQKAIKSARAGTGNLTSKGFTTNAENLLEFVLKLPALLKKSNTALVDQGAAFKSLKQIGEEYADFTSSLQQTNTEFSRSMQITKNAIDSVTGAMAKGSQDQAFLKVFQDAEGGEAVLRILQGMSQEERERITVKEVLVKLQEKNNRLLQIENDVLLQQTKTQILKEKSMRNLTPLQKGLLDNEFKQRSILDEISKIQGQRALLTEEELAQDSSRAKQLDLQLQLLREQLETVRQQNDAFLELSNSAKGAFEGATQGGIAELIKGDESSIKDAMLKIAKATLSAVADTLAKQITEKITGALFGTPEDKIRLAHMEGAEVVKQKIKEGHQEGLATTVPGKVPTASNLLEEVTTPERDPKSSIPSPTGFFGKLLGTKTTGKVTVGNEREGFTESSKTRRTGGIFSGFINAFSDVFDKNIEGGFLQKMGSVFQEGGSLFGDLFKSLPQLLGSLFGGMGGGGAGGILGTLATLFFANGGIAKGGFRSAAYAKGGIATQPTVGLVGEGRHNEAIVPLPDGKSIPVSMNGMGQQNNVTVNVSIDNDGQASRTEQSDGTQGADLGKVIAAAVQQELMNQRRNGGILSPFGAA